MENIFNSILLFIITGLLAAFGIGLKKFAHKFFNKIDILDWKTKAINYGCEETLLKEYKDKRDEKWADLIEEDELKNKER